MNRRRADRGRHSPESRGCSASAASRRLPDGVRSRPARPGSRRCPASGVTDASVRTVSTRWHAVADASADKEGGCGARAAMPARFTFESETLPEMSSRGRSILIAGVTRNGLGSELPMRRTVGAPCRPGVHRAAPPVGQGRRSPVGRQVLRTGLCSVWSGVGRRGDRSRSVRLLLPHPGLSRGPAAP
jgi:hypothetical protein